MYCMYVCMCAGIWKWLYNPPQLYLWKELRDIHRGERGPDGLQVGAHAGFQDGRVSMH